MYFFVVVDNTNKSLLLLINVASSLFNDGYYCHCWDHLWQSTNYLFTNPLQCFRMLVNAGDIIFSSVRHSKMKKLLFELLMWFHCGSTININLTGWCLKIINNNAWKISFIVDDLTLHCSTKMLTDGSHTLHWSVWWLLTIFYWCSTKSNTIISRFLTKQH